MSIASFALGYGCGVLSSGLLAVAGVLAGSVAAWRLARAIERQGIDVTVKQDDATGGR